MSLFLSFVKLISSCLALMAVIFLQLWSGGTWMKTRLLGFWLPEMVLFVFFVLVAGAGPSLLEAGFFWVLEPFCGFLL
jgi:hypothetical protein